MLSFYLHCAISYILLKVKKNSGLRCRAFDIYNIVDCWQPLALPSHPDIVISVFNHEDIDDIFECESQSSGYPWSAANFRSSLSDGHLCLGLKKDGKWIAHAVFSCVVDQLELLILSVSPEYKRQGLAAGFLGEVMQQFSEKKLVSEVLLEVRVSNVAAINLYKKLGFVQVGIRKGYYAISKSVSGKEDALLFLLVL